MIKKMLLIGLIFLMGCNSRPRKPQIIGEDDSTRSGNLYINDSTYRPYHSLEFAMTDTQIDTSQFYLINNICAISILPDTSWLRDRQKTMSEDTWNTIVDDHQYYEGQGENTLKSNGINVIYRPNNRRFIKFIKSDNQAVIIDRQKMKDSWGLILFNGNENPVFWMSTDIGIALNDIYLK